MTEHTKINEAAGKRIKAARNAKGLSQEQLGAKLGVSFQAVSTWETGKNIPDAEHLPVLAKELDISLDALFSGEEERPWRLRPVNDDPDRMFTFVKGRAQMLKLPQTLAVLGILREAHGKQRRRSRNGFETSYVVHPLTIACHALALGLKDDDVIAACLAHDLVEDTDMKPADLPVGERVREAVRLVSKSEYKWSEDWEETYYGEIQKNPLACLVKCLDRVNNVAGMADAFGREKMIRYTAETDRYYLDLLDEIRDIPEWNDAWWLLRYQLRTMLEAFKRLL